MTKGSGEGGGAAVHDTGLDQGRGLTHASLFTIDYIAVPANLSDCITTFYHFRCEEAEIRDIQPAAVGHFTLFPHGNGTMNFDCGRVDRSHEVNLLTPFSQAVPFVMAGPFHAIGAVLTPHGWAALTGLCARQHGNRLHRAADILGEEAERFGAGLCDEYRRGTRTGTQCAHAIGQFVAGTCKPLNPRHATLIAATNRWLGSALNPDLAVFFASANYSQRQAQRLVERYFGLSPKALARKYRALRAAALMSFPMLSDEMEAELGEAFYDQSHMIREIRLFAGRTPTKLANRESPFLSEMLDAKNFRELNS